MGDYTVTMIMHDPGKIRMSREILSDGPGYKMLSGGRSWTGNVETTKYHMGKPVSALYIPTSEEWEPPLRLVDKWWNVVNEKGNTVGLKARIPVPEHRAALLHQNVFFENYTGGSRYPSQ